MRIVATRMYYVLTRVSWYIRVYTHTNFHVLYIDTRIVATRISAAYMLHTNKYILHTNKYILLYIDTPIVAARISAAYILTNKYILHTNTRIYAYLHRPRH